MPSRSLSFHQSDSNGIVVIPKSLVNLDTDVLEKTFNQGLELNEWDNWMKWEDATIELLPNSARYGENMDNNESSPDTWSMGLETSGVDMMLTSCAAATEFPFADASFEFENPLRTTANLTNHNNVPYLYTTSSSSIQNPAQQESRRSYRGFSSLTESEEQNLQDIAMPYNALSRVTITSQPVSPVDSQGSESLSPSSEPEQQTRKNNKRKSFELGELPSIAICQSKKRGHNAIEKRYRTNLNTKIESLREGIPPLCGPNINAGEEESDGEGDNKSSQKYGKAAVLTRALEYIQYLEKTTQRLGSEVDTLKTRVEAFEKLAMSGSFNMNGSMETINRTALMKRETLESIQSDFQQIQPKPKVVSGPAARRRGPRQTRF